MNDQQQSRADALTEAQRKALETAVNVLNINWEHETANELWEAFTAPVSQPSAAPIDEPTIPAELHHDTAKLVRRFARALANKLLAAQRKYGYSDNWMRDDWADECRAELMRHIQKGDPRDVAAYCAFLWHHNESTTPALRAPSPAAERAAPDVPEKRHATDPEQQWQQFWREICTNADGSINLEQVKRELSDFSMLLSWVPRVYMHVTGGKVSKENTWPSVVMSLHDEHVNELVEAALRSELEARAASANETGAEGASYRAGIEAVAKFIDKKADDYAQEFGYDDLGSLSFGQGAHADAKRDFHSSLVELAEEVRALDVTTPQPAQADARVGLTMTREQRGVLTRLATVLETGHANNGIADDNAEIYAMAIRALLATPQPEPRAEDEGSQ